MAFKGDLRNISLFDIFQTLNTNNQTGVLVLQREGVTKKIFFSPQGVRIFFTKSFRPLRLGEIFVRRGFITAEEVEILLLEQKREYRPIGELLIQTGKVPPTEVARVLRYHAEDEVFDIFGWNCGTFAFFDGQGADDKTTPLSDVVLDPAGLCLEAARRLDEVEHLREVVPSNEDFWVQAGGGLEADRDTNDPRVCTVFDALRTPYNVDDLRDMVGLSLFDVLRSIYALATGGLIRPLTAEELLAAAREAREAGQPDRAAQLFEKAHALAPNNQSLLLECVDVVKRLQDAGRLAGHLASLGVLCIGNNQVEEGIEHLEQALRHEPDNFTALSGLRTAFAKMEDGERAAEVSLRIARAHAERNDLAQAIEACRSGLSISPTSIALRFYLGQVLLRAERTEEARQELHTLVQETETSRKAMRSDKAIELLQSCYRMLLKIDPQDERALRGVKELDRRRASTGRRQTLAIRIAVASAILGVAGAIGLTFRGPGASELFQRVAEAQQAGNTTLVLDAIDALVKAHPRSDEAGRALSIRKSIEMDRSSAEQARRKREDELRRELDGELEDLRRALTEQAYIDGLGLVSRYLERINRPEAAPFRKNLVSYVLVSMNSYLESVADQFEKDRQAVAITGRQIESTKDRRTAAALREMEERLNQIRARRWAETVPAMMASLTALRVSPYMGENLKQIEDFRKKLESGKGAFDVLDTLYYTVRSARLRTEIEEAVRTAHAEGTQHLTLCEFEEARALYARAAELADSVASETPRERFLDLILTISRTHVLEDMRDKVEQIDLLVERLAEAEKLRSEGRAAEAFRVFRPLVEAHMTVQFERKYRMPYAVVSTPEGCDVFVDEEKVGKTPAAIALDITKNTKIRVAREGFEATEATLSPLDPKLEGTLDVQLSKKVGWELELSGDLEAPPVVAGDLLFVASRSGSLFAVRGDGSGTLWEGKTGVLEGIGARPAVDGERIHVVTLDGTLHTFRITDGAVLARVELPGPVTASPAVADSTFYAATRYGRLVAVRDGKVLFDQPMRKVPATGLVVLRGVVYVGSGEGELLAFDAATGAPKGSIPTPGRAPLLGDLVVSGDLVFGATEDGMLVAFDTAASSVAWKFAAGARTDSPAAGEDNVVYVPSRDGFVYGVMPGGERSTSFTVGGYPIGSPVVAHGFLYSGSGHRVAAFDAQGRKPWWEASLKDETVRHLAAGGKFLFALTDHSRVVAFPLDER